MGIQRVNIAVSNELDEHIIAQPAAAENTQVARGVGDFGRPIRPEKFGVPMYLGVCWV